MTETRNYYTTTRNHADYSAFGGYVYNYDFDGYNSLSTIAERIASDWKFDNTCRKNALNRNRVNNNKKVGK